MSPRVPKSEKAQLLGAALRDTPREFVLFLQALVRRGRQQILRARWRSSTWISWTRSSTGSGPG